MKRETSLLRSELPTQAKNTTFFKDWSIIYYAMNNVKLTPLAGQEEFVIRLYMYIVDAEEVSHM